MKSQRLLTTNIFCAVTFLYITGINGYTKFPQNFPKCNRLDPKLNECLLKATETVKPFLKKGVPELKIPPLENFFIPEIVIEQGTQALNFRAQMTNIVVRGMDDYKFSKFEFDPANLTYSWIGSVNNLTIEGNTSITGNLLIVPINGNGTFTAGVDTITLKYTEKMQLVKKSDGEEYIKPEHITTSIVASGPKTQLFGIFDKNGKLNEVANKVISDNANLFFDEMKPALENVVEKVVKDLILKNIEDSIPYKDIYDSVPVAA